MDNDFDTEEKSIWQKSQQELTIGEAVTVSLGVGLAVAALPLAAAGIVAGVVKLSEKRAARKAEKEAEKIIAKKKCVDTTCKVKD